MKLAYRVPSPVHLIDGHLAIVASEAVSCPPAVGGLGVGGGGAFVLGRDGGREGGMEGKQGEIVLVRQQSCS